MTSVVATTSHENRNANREARRRQLIEATIESIAELGFNETTLATVTTRAGLSHGTINFHFKSKELLLVETLRYLASEHRAHWRAAVCEAESRPEKQLAAMIETDFDPAICNGKRLSVWFSFWGDKRCRPAYLDICGQIDAERLNEFERLCRLIRKEGGYSHADPVLVAKSLQSLIDGIWLNKLCQPELYLRGEARRMCVSFLAGWFPNHFSPKGEYSAE